MFGIDQAFPLSAEAQPMSAQNYFFEQADTGLTNEAWARLMDLFRDEMAWTDTRLSEHIGISISMIRQCRILLRPVPQPARVRIMGAMGIEVTLSSLVAALPLGVREAVDEANRDIQVIRETLVYSFFDRLDTEEGGYIINDFLAGLARIAGVAEEGIAERIGLSTEELEKVKVGEKPLPFRSKMAIFEGFSAHDLGPLMLSLLPAM